MARCGPAPAPAHRPLTERSQLREWGVERALLHGGASTALAMDPPPGRRGWGISLRDPADSSAQVLGRLSLRGRAFSGSGTAHERHIVDPHTGRAVPTGRAAWCVHESAAVADAVTTALCVMETLEAEDYARKHPTQSFVIASCPAGAWRLRAFGPAILLPCEPGRRQGGAPNQGDRK